MRIINLTQHDPTPEQIEAGVFDPDPAVDLIRDYLTFNALPPRKEDVEARAEALARIAEGWFADAAMIGGAPWLMAPLEMALLKRGIKPAYSCSRRESVEETLPDGSVRKTSVFRHVGFYFPYGK